MAQVQQFLRICLDIVLWRRGPQDLPVSGLLLWLTAAAYVAVSAAQLARANVRYCLQAYAAAVVWLAVIGSVLGVKLLSAWS